MTSPITITIPNDWDDWDDNALILFEEFCELIHTPPSTVQEWRRSGMGPRWARFQGVGRLYITAGEARRFLTSATAPGEGVRSDASGHQTPRTSHGPQ